MHLYREEAKIGKSKPLHDLHCIIDNNTEDMNTNNIKLQKREIFTPGIQLREAQEGNQGIIDGLAVVVDRETVLYEDELERVIESIAPSCLEEEFVREQDIKLNMLHKRDLSFARVPKSLRVMVEADGLHYEADIPDCDLGKQARALIENGTYTGNSFEFWPKDYTVTERKGADGKNEVCIRHTQFEAIDALTIAMTPAYKDTTVSAREAWCRELLDTLHQKPVVVRESSQDDEQKQREVEAQLRQARRRHMTNNFNY